MIGITKSFPGVVANNDIDFDLKAGEIHSILGENGAGKTTLMNILAGIIQPDKGAIKVRDRTAKIRAPQDSLKLGIGMVYQHFTLIPNLSVLENLMLGFEDGILLNRKKARDKFHQISESYGLMIASHRKVEELSIGERQRTEILKILYHDSDVLILDEPTSVLSPAEAAKLYQTIELLRDAGKSIILITHNLAEALAVSDRITVMRAGRIAAQLPGDKLRALDAKTASDKIFNLMFGTAPRTAAPLATPVLQDDSLLVLEDVAALNNKGQMGMKCISLEIKSGEILGITGMAGEAQQLLAEVISGQKRATSGKILYRRRDIGRLDIAKRYALGISYITADRINEGCVLEMTLSENSILQSFKDRPFSKFGILNQAHINASTADLISRFGIRTTGPEAPVKALSGGNIQKLLLARGLSAKPDLIICNSPTYGLDARTVHFVQNLLKEESRRGAAVLLITADMEELFSCSDRIGVLFKGEIAGLMQRREATTENVGKLMLGVS